MKIKAANSGGLKLLGGVFLKITGYSSSGRKWQTRQMAYCADGCDRLFLSKTACVDLGILEQSFPEVGRFKDAGINSIEETGDVEAGARIFTGKCEPYTSVEGEEVCSCPPWTGTDFFSLHTRVWLAFPSKYSCSGLHVSCLLDTVDSRV